MKLLQIDRDHKWHKFETYHDVYLHVKGTITVTNTVGAGAVVKNTSKKVIFKNCALFTNCLSKINNTKVDDAQDIDLVMPRYYLLEYSDA